MEVDRRYGLRATQIVIALREGCHRHHAEYTGTVTDPSGPTALVNRLTLTVSGSPPVSGMTAADTDPHLNPLPMFGIIWGRRKAPVGSGP